METSDNKNAAIARRHPSNFSGMASADQLDDGPGSALTGLGTRRRFIETLGWAGATLVAAPLASLLFPAANVASNAAQDFTFAILADSHTMGKRNPAMKKRLLAATKQINAIKPAPDFVMYLGDAVHDGNVEQFKYFEEIIATLEPKIFYLAGEHDWYLDMGEYYMQHMIRRPTPYYSFDHKGAHVMALHGSHLNDFWSARKLTPEERMQVAGDISDTTQGPFILGKKQLDWMERDLANVPTDAPILVFSHAPLYHYYKPWNFWVQDAADAHAIFAPFKNVQVFHAHVHQLVEHRIARIKFHGILSTSWPHPYPETYHALGLSGQMPRSNPAEPFDGLGWHIGQVQASGFVSCADILWTMNPPTA
ncbi:MAG: metallophosphoesterase [Collimonas fungivorans]|uniref:metallophosphoesterase family protein n=1 Tax=Collimonas fungivorans TaxID=158899 RepID=UPI0026EFA81A|nr:metallophosphoesterase [Collimonas fungivorans]MDB5768407.1 metallophosphoesterase [Collimonas fungivorans]